MTARTQGQNAALAVLGLEKVAQPLYDGPDGQKLPFWPSIRANVARQLIGDPGRYWDELKAGKWSAPGSYTRASLWPSGPRDPKAGLFSRALSHTMPALYYLPSALSLYAATQAPSEAKGEAYGSALGSLAGTLAGAPLGILGTAVGGIAGERLGSSLGKMFQRKNTEPTYHDASAYGMYG